MATGIVMIEVVYTIPLLALIYVNGDTQIEINEANPPFTNVSHTIPHEYYQRTGFDCDSLLIANFEFFLNLQ